MAVSLDRWQKMETAPRDGRKILVAVGSTEQGPAELDVVHWGLDPSSGESWIASDSENGAVFAYGDAELSGWMLLPARLPPLRNRQAERKRAPEPSEGEGSGI
ncbi:MAG: hypothetical protein IT535_11545 [Bauldia sp.]|nr:hypothetical protein [Bauldia sp.]